MMKRAVLWLSAGTAMMGAGQAWAADKVLYQPTPDWVAPAPALDPAKITDASPIVLMLDNQQRLKDGEVWSYAETATRIASSEVLGQVGTVSFPWQPAAGDLIIHKAEIVRGAERIDLLKSGKGFSVIRREQQLEQRMLDGMLTATMPVEGLRVGDILHLAISTTRKDAMLQGQMQSFSPLPSLPFRVDYARVRLLWPTGAKVAWKAYADGVRPSERDVGGYHELVVALPLAKQPEMPSDAPVRFRKLPTLEATSFAGWGNVAAVMAPLYATDGLIPAGSPLAAEVDRIRTAETDPMKRTALALRLVQEKVRYLFNGMDQGNYLPQKPADTWSLRYGDCKAKTLLLLSILHGLGIEAEPVLASSELGDMVPVRLPTPGAFDHVLVKAVVGGETLWLDGTDNGVRLEDMKDTPAFAYVLPVRAGAALLPITMRPHARPDIAATIDLDERAGIDLPAPMTLAVTFRGRLAEMIRAAKAQASKDDLSQMVRKLSVKLAPNATIVGRSITFDEASGTATVIARGIAYPGWSRTDERYKSEVDGAVSDIDFDPDRSAAAWSAVPVAIGGPITTRLIRRIRMPGGGAGYVLEGDQRFATPLAGTTIRRTVTNADGVLTIDDTSSNAGGEIAPADLPAARAAVAAAKSRLLTMVAPADVPTGFRQIDAAKRAKAFEPTLALYAEGVSDRPGDAEPFTNRAWFLDRIFERQRAIDDLGRAIAIKPDVATYQWRAGLYRALGQRDKAAGDLTAALKLDPASDGVVTDLATLEIERGSKDAALALVQQRIDAGGKGKAGMMAVKADLLARAGDRDAALSTIDAALVASPGNASLLNQRCWLKGTLNVALDTALKDCTRSIELSDSATAALDSRALVYFRMNRFDDAMADLSAALANSPGLAASLYMRGVILGKQGKAEGQQDLAAARAISPLIDDDYKRYGIVP